jgi:hypothetical protein
LEKKLDVDFGDVLLKLIAYNSIRDPCVDTLGIGFSLIEFDCQCHLISEVVLIDFIIVSLWLLARLHK